MGSFGLIRRMELPLITEAPNPRFAACVRQRLLAHSPRAVLQNGTLASANETVTTIGRQPCAGRSHDATKVAIRRISLGSTSSGA
jgi:hypothetical protein